MGKTRSAGVLILLACAHLSRAQPSTDLPHPCSLVTQADVEAAMGKGATLTRNHNPRTGLDECRLESPDPKLTEIKIVIHRADLFAASKKQLVSGGADVKSVSGPGEDAYVGRAVGYNVRKGNKWIQIFGVVTNDDSANDKATRYLAEKAAARL